MTSLTDLPTLKEFTELSEESRKRFETELGEDAPDGPIDLSKVVVEGISAAVPEDDESEGEGAESTGPVEPDAPTERASVEDEDKADDDEEGPETEPDDEGEDDEDDEDDDDDDEGDDEDEDEDDDDDEDDDEDDDDDE